MKNTRYGALLAMLALFIALVAGSFPPPASRAQSVTSPVITQVVSTAAASGQSTVLALDGRFNNCSIIAGDSGSASITVWGNAQGAGPGASPIVNPNFGTNGVVSVSGATLAVSPGNVANLPTGLYFTWASNTGTLVAWAVCSQSIARGGSGGGGGGGGTPAPGFCIGVSTPPASGTIAYTCATPGPQATPSPSATSTSTAGPPSATWTGSWPYTLQVNFPTGGGSVSTPSSYDNMIEGEVQLFNYFPLSDASGAAIDHGLGATTAAGGTPTYHTASLCCNGDLSMTFPGANATNFMKISPNGNIGIGGTTSFWAEAWVEWASLPSATSIIFSNENSGGTAGSQLRLGSNNHFHLVFQNVADTDTGFAVSAATAYYVAWVWDGVYSYLFVNGTLAYQAETKSSGLPTDSTFTIGASTDSSNLGANSMIIQKLGIYAGSPGPGEITRHYNCGHSNVCKWAWNP